MLDAKKMLDCAGKNISEILNMVDPAQIEEIATALAEAKRVFTAGWGRAGNIIRILGMDMSQIGKTVFCVGDNGTPSAHPGDLLIINSGSGNTKTIAVLAQQAKEQGLKVALISGAAPVLPSSARSLISTLPFPDSKTSSARLLIIPSPRTRAWASAWIGAFPTSREKRWLIRKLPATTKPLSL